MEECRKTEGCIATMKRWLKTSLAVCMSATLLAGCSFGKGNESSNNQPTTLKVMYYDESQFHSEYGMLFSALNPNVEFEIVSTSRLYQDVTEEKDYETLLQELIDAENPDVLMLEPAQITSLGDEGKLYDIENLVNEEKYNAAGLAPGVIDSMKTLSSGKLYGLPTSFYSQVIYYNKDLFEEYGIPFPTDQMTWSEVIDLAKMFPTDGEPMDRVYGLKMGWNKDLNELVTVLSQGESLRMFDPDTLQMTIDTPAWNSLVETAQSVLSSNSLFFESDMYNDDGYMNYEGDYYSRDPFFAGRMAMRLDGNYFINDLENLKNHAENPDDLIQNWDMVTAPVSSSNPEESSYINYYNIFAINNTSTNVEQAWNFISYITGDDYARVKSKVTYGNLPLRTAFMSKGTDRNYDAFYKVRPSSQNINMDYNKVPDIFQFEFYSLMQTELAKVNDGDASIGEALSTLQIKGNEMLAQGKMTQEEIDQYWKDKYGEDGGGVVRPMEIEMLEEAAGEATVEEEVAE
jgi:multiple sugar transport system substrate-binding protein